MAKLKMPLGSLGASGQLGKALVYFPWKGLNCVREHVVPANPKSQAQRDQRDLMTAAVAEYHAALYTALDMTAWARLAGTIKASMTGFNAMVQAHVKEGVLANVWCRLHHAASSNPQVGSFAVSVTKVSAGNIPDVHYGISKTFMPNKVAMVDQTGDLWLVNVIGLTKKTLYYFWIDVGTTAEDYARTGIYSERTLAA